MARGRYNEAYEKLRVVADADKLNVVVSSSIFYTNIITTIITATITSSSPNTTTTTTKTINTASTSTTTNKNHKRHQANCNSSVYVLYAGKLKTALKRLEVLLFNNPVLYLQVCVGVCVCVFASVKS